MIEETVWQGGFSSKEDIEQAFETVLPSEIKLLVAAYDGGYECDAFVLFERDGKLFEVYGAHCSCFGLEGQWEPEESNPAELLKRAMDNLHYVWESSEVQIATQKIAEEWSRRLGKEESPDG